MLTLWEEIYGPDSREIGSTLYNLGTLLGWMEKYEEAELLLRRELNICIASAGDSDPETADSMNNLAEVLKARGDIAGMSEMRLRQLAVLERIAGPESDEVLWVMQTLAVCLRDHGRLDEAEPLQREAMARFIRVHGEASVEAAGIYNAMGALLELKGDLETAEAFSAKALAIEKLGMGPIGDGTILVRGRLERLLAEKGEFSTIKRPGGAACF